MVNWIVKAPSCIIICNWHQAENTSLPALIQASYKVVDKVPIGLLPTFLGPPHSTIVQVKTLIPVDRQMVTKATFVNFLTIHTIQSKANTPFASSPNGVK